MVRKIHRFALAAALAVSLGSSSIVEAQFPKKSCGGCSKEAPAAKAPAQAQGVKVPAAKSACGGCSKEATAAKSPAVENRRSTGSAANHQGCSSATQCSSGTQCTKEVAVGAERSDVYLPWLAGKKVGLYSNHTGLVSGPKGPYSRHTVDKLREEGVNMKVIFSPEHGFRGTADAGEHVATSIDPETGLTVASLYGSDRKNTLNQWIDSVETVIVDIQDVGLRYYTYYCTMLEIMDAAAQKGKEVIIFDRPNPNGMYVDGPILDMTYESGVGRAPITVVHGLTLGELARMANGEGWLKSGKKADLKVVPMENYTHQTRYKLPVAPSPNLRTMLSIYLYPAVCYFEATKVSLGRGTDKPFEIYGHPDFDPAKYPFSFTPRSVDGAKNPPQLDQLCHGVDLSGMTEEQAIANGVDLTYLIDSYNALGKPEMDQFFRKFFELLIGRGDIRDMIKEGKSAAEIKATWAGDVEKFKKQRKPYLLYAE